MKVPRILCGAVLVLALSGCAILGVRGQQERFSDAARFLGTVRTDDSWEHPLVVVLARWDGEAATLVDYFVLDCSGRFFFTASAGTYMVFAFKDSNENLRCDRDEPAIPLAEGPVPDHVATQASSREVALARRATQLGSRRLDSRRSIVAR